MTPALCGGVSPNGASSGDGVVYAVLIFCRLTLCPDERSSDGGPYDPSRRLLLGNTQLWRSCSATRYQCRTYA